MAPQPEITPIGTTVYFRYASLGLSFEFEGPKGAAPDLDQFKLVGIDVENHDRNDDELAPPPATQCPPTASPYRSTGQPSSKHLSPFLHYPILIPSSPPFQLDSSTTGQDLVGALGEPTRKGGGKTGLGIWVEWDNVGLFVQWRGNKAIGGGKVWEDGKHRKWGTAKLFEPVTIQANPDRR